MAKSRRNSCRKSGRRSSKRRMNHTRRRYFGGNTGSGNAYELNNVGTLEQQIQNSLYSHPGESIVAAHNTQTVPMNNLNANSTQVTPSAAQLALIQKAGGMRRRKHHKKRGGSLGAMLNAAIAPLTLLGLQNRFGKTIRRNRSRRHR